MESLKKPSSVSNERTWEGQAYLDHGLLTRASAKCIDTYIALSSMRSPIAPANSAQHLPPELMTAFPQNNDGAASMSASLTSPTMPFTQSTLPSKSLLSRESTATALEPVLTNGGPPGTVGAHASTSVPRSMQENLQAVVESLFEQCFQEGRYRQVIGIAIEARNLEVLKGAILRAAKDDRKAAQGKPGEASASKSDELMEYVLDLCMTVVQERALRNEVRPRSSPDSRCCNWPP